LLKNVVVPEAQDFPSECLQGAGAFSVLLASMLPTIGFDDQSGLYAGKVGDERANRNLPAKFESAETVASQVMPQPPLGIGRIASQPARMRIRFPDRRHGCSLEEGRPSPNPLP
jgi:hypothetical protein